MAFISNPGYEELNINAINLSLMGVETGSREYPAIKNYRTLRTLELRHGFDPADLHLPDRLATYGPLREVLPDLRRDFTTYWYTQLDRISREPHALDIALEMDAQEGFAEDAGFFHLKTSTIGNLVEAQPGRPVLALDDADETDGRIPDTKRKIVLPGFGPRREDKLTDNQKKELDHLRWLDAFQRFQVRPAAPLANKWIHATYGDQVQLGSLSTKAEEGLRQIAPRLGPVKPSLVMGCTDGTALELIPDVVALVAETTKQRETLTFARVMKKFRETSPPGRAVLTERVIADLQGKFSEYDLKVLMMIRLLERSRREGLQQLASGHQFPQSHQEEWFEGVHPEMAIVLFDDAAPESVLPHDSSLRYVQVPRFRLPEDFY